MFTCHTYLFIKMFKKQNFLELKNFELDDTSFVKKYKYYISDINQYVKNMNPVFYKKKSFEINFSKFNPDTKALNSLSIYKKLNLNQLQFEDLVTTVKPLTYNKKKRKFQKKLIKRLKFLNSKLAKNYYFFLLTQSIWKHNSWVFFKSFIRLLLWSVPVPRHRSIFFWNRLFFKYLAKYHQKKFVKGLGYRIKGKIAATGDKRKSILYKKYGYGNANTLSLNMSCFSFLIRTTSGALNMTVFITYKY